HKADDADGGEQPNPALDEIAALLDKGAITPARLLELAKGDLEKPAAADETAKVAARSDVSEADKKRAKDEYGDVQYADEKNKKYPIDTEAHIRAAWNYIDKDKNASKYSAEDLKKIKARIVAAWKKVIDKAGPPSEVDKSDSGGDLAKSMWDVGQLASLLSTLNGIRQSTAYEAAAQREE